MKGNLMELDKEISEYCNDKEFCRAKVHFYDVFQLNICRKITKLVTFTDEHQKVRDLNKYLIFSEVEEFGNGKLTEENFKKDK